MSILERADWKTDVHWGTIDLHVDGVHGFIQKRPYYCDRGHYSFNVDGIPEMDSADSFPRYYMTLEAALCEASDFINWRLYQSDERLVVTLDDKTIRA